MDAEMLQIIGKPTASQEARIGVVTYFKDEPKAQYGFVKTDLGDVFIHSSKGYKLADNGTDLPGLAFLDKTIEGHLLNTPKRGDKVAVVMEQGNKGWRAVRWVVCSDEAIETVLNEILNRKNYEVVICKGKDLEIGSAKVLWKGTDLSKLKIKYPKDKYPLTDIFYITINGNRITDEIR
jgi:cold shock CspA family protein